MTEDVVTLPPDASRTDALRLMQERRIRRIPLVAEGAVVGVVTLDDLLADEAASLEDFADVVRAQVGDGGPMRFRRKSGETVGRLIDRMKRLLEEREATAVMEAAATAIPARLRPSAFAIVADLLHADGRIDARERKFLQRLAVNFNIRARVANHVIEAMLVKNHL